MAFDPFAIYDAGNTNLLWGVEIDWDNDGSFDENEAHERLVDIHIKRGRDYYVRPAGDGFEPYITGICSLLMLNHDGKYTPTNSGSPLYGDLDPGKFMQVKTKNGGSGAEEQLFAGKVVDIAPITAGDWSRVFIHCSDGLNDLRDNEVNMAALFTDVTVDEGIDDVLDDVAWPVRWGRNIDGGQSLFLTLGADQVNAMRAIDTFAQMDLGWAFHARDGNFRFINRADTQASQLTINQADITKNFYQYIPIEAKRNVVEVVVYDWQDQGINQIIWTLDSVIAVLAGQTVDLIVPLTDESGNGDALVSSAIHINAATATSNEDGTGIDLSSFITETVTRYSWHAKVSFENTGTQTAYIQTASVTSSSGSIYFPNYSTVIRSEGTGASTDPRLFKLDLRFFNDYDVARDWAEYLSDYLGNIGEFYYVEYHNHWDKQFGLEIYDKVTLNAAEYGVSSLDLRVGMIEIVWNHEAGQDVMSRFRLEPFIDASDFWVFTTQIGTTSKFGM